MSAISLATAQDQFTATLSAVEDAVRFAFRGRMKDQEYQEAMAEAKAAAWSSWAGLIKRGKDPVKVGAHGIATNAIRYVKNGRRVGNKGGGRGAMDVYHRRAQAKCGFKLVSLDSGDDAGAVDSTPGAWRGWLAEDRRVGPADLACSRLDFAAWLAGLPAKQRKVAELLADGHDGVVVARLVGLSPGRVSQLRPVLEARWREFQGQARDEPGWAMAPREVTTKRRGRPRRADRDPVEVATGTTPRGWPTAGRG